MILDTSCTPQEEKIKSQTRHNKNQTSPYQTKTIQTKIKVNQNKIKLESTEPGTGQPQFVVE